MAIKELLGSRRTEKTLNGRKGFRQFLVTWDDRETDPPELGDTFPEDDTLYVSRVNVFQYPDTKPNDIGDGYEWAKVEVEYDSRAVQGAGVEPPLPISMEFSTEALNVGSGRKWSTRTGNPPINAPAHGQNVIKLFPKVEIVAKRYRDEIPIGEIKAAIGRINNTQTTIGSDIFGVEELLFVAASAQEEFIDANNKRYIITMKFINNEDNWNKAWRGGVQDKHGNGALKWDNAIAVMKEDNGFFDRLIPALYKKVSFNNLLAT